MTLTLIATIATLLLVIMWMYLRLVQAEDLLVEAKSLNEDYQAVIADMRREAESLASEVNQIANQTPENQ